jgi:hypothetical protein
MINCRSLVSLQATQNETAIADQPDPEEIITHPISS